MKRFLLVLLIAFLAIPSWAVLQIPIGPMLNLSKVNIRSQEIQQKTIDVKTWQMPSYMLENLRYMRDEFNREFDAKLEYFKKELAARFDEFKDMPNDVIFIENDGFKDGYFITRNDYLRLLKEAQKRKK